MKSSHLDMIRHKRKGARWARAVLVIRKYVLVFKNTCLPKTFTIVRIADSAFSTTGEKTPDSTRCELVMGGLTTRAKPPQGASARTRRGRSARWHNPTINLSKHRPPLRTQIPDNFMAKSLVRYFWPTESVS